MGIWIRSQDKTKLLKAESLEYCTEREQITKELKDKKGKPIYYLGRPAEEVVEEKIYHCIFVNNLNCEFYSSEEKALKVLGMIQDKIIYRELTKDLKFNDMSANMYNEHIKKLNPVFEMPQDDEV